MSLFNEKLKTITLKELLILIIALFLIQYLINTLNIIHIDSVWIYIFIIFFFFFKLKDELFSVKSEISNVFRWDIIKSVVFIVVLNVFLSYGMLYLSNFILNVTPLFNLFNSFLTGGILATIIVSPISEELIFRGVFLNRLQLIVPPVFAILISSLLFASLHTFGSIFSAFIFAICVSILYLKTDNIFVAIFAHFLNNLFAEMIVILDSNNILFTNDAVVLVMSVLAVISFCVIVISIVKEFKSIKNNKF